MSLIRTLFAAGRAHPVVLSLVAGAIVLAGLPLTNASHFGTGGEDVTFTAAATTSVHFDGAYLGEQLVQTQGAPLTVSSAYELRVVDIVPSGNATTVEIRAPNGTVVVGGSPYTIGANSSVRNVTFLVSSSALPHTGLYGLHEVGGPLVGRLFVGPRGVDVVVDPATLQHQPNTSVVMRVSTGIAGMNLSGEVPPGAVTDANGNYTFIRPVPPAGTYAIHARKDTGGDGLPERIGTGHFVVTAAGAQLVQHNLMVPAAATAGQPVQVRVNVTNEGAQAGNGTVTLLVNNIQRGSQALTLDGGATHTVVFEFTPMVAGTYEVATRLGNHTLGPQMLTVSAQAAPTEFRIGHYSGGMLHAIAAPITLANASDFGSATLTLTVDPSVVSVLGVGNGTIPGADLTWSYNGSSGVVTILVTTPHRPGINGSAVLATVTFQAAGPAGSESALDLEVVELVTSDGVDAPWTAVDGSFRAGLIGDADGDGDIDLDDVLAISEVVVGNRPASSVHAANADVSRDGLVTGRDAMMIRQYLAGTRASL